ncbi:MAG: MFS transporter [Burkholderiales bacterium]
MSVALPAHSTLAPFRVRSYRFQWHADLAASWAFEMETIILGWYILVETQSVLLLTLFASLQYIGTLAAPMFGVMGHRIGNKRTYCAMRATYATLAAFMMILALTGVLTPLYVFIIATLMGMVRPSDLVLRYALIGESMPAAQLTGAASISRTTQDSARVMGALAGAGLVALLGMGFAYVAITLFYVGSLLLSLQVSGKPVVAHPDTTPEIAPTSAWRDLKDGVAYVWTTPHLLAAIYLAFLVNLTAFPFTLGLLPYVAKEIYHTNQTGLGYLVASFAFGALVGSIALSRIGHTLPSGRMMVGFCAVWYCMIWLFAQMPVIAGGIPMLMLAGCAQSLALVPMSAMLLRNTGESFRGRVMGLRMLMIYGVPVGLMIAGPMISHFGFRTTATTYCVIGLAFTALIGVRWRHHIWRLDAPANKR